MIKGYIYKITSPSGRVYIGKTTNIKNRISYYKSNTNNQQKIISSSIKKYGWDNHIFEIIHEAPVEQLSELEIKCIKENNTFHYDNPKGMNLTLGGEGLLGTKQSPETIEKRVQKLMGQKRSEETKKLMSELKKGKAPACTKNPKTEHFLKVAKESKLGRKHSVEEIQLMKQTKLNNLIKKHESILQIDVITKQVIKEWVMLPKDIAKELKMEDTMIYKSLKGKYTPLKKGFIWRYKNEL